MQVLIVIPARLASTRLPNKMLLSETGMTLLEHTYRAAERCTTANKVIIAADSRKVEEAAKAFGGNVCMTDPNHPSGTDRVAEVSGRYPEFDMIVNLQGDEPEIDPELIDAAVKKLIDSPEASVSTVAVPIVDPEQISNPACVKLVMDCNGLALYFSRSPIPFIRNSESGVSHWQHVGLYVFRRDFLLRFSDLAPSALEKCESLEQLRVLENGLKIAVATAKNAPKGIDTIEDYQAFVNRQRTC
ncbi:MAG: 3-deoxy-manno-octulosonate cytidylyltransferase [Pirellulaceae bacterium]